MSKKFTPDLIIKFLRLYEQYPCLWDVNSASYKNRICRENAYEEIAETLNIDGFSSSDVKMKIRSIRNAYTLELTKIAKSKKSGSKKIYKPKVSWFSEADRILHKVVHTTRSHSTETVSDDSINQSNCDDLAESIHSASAICSPVLTINNKLENVTSTLPNQMKKTEYGQGHADKAIGQLKFMSEISNQPPLEENEFDCFAKSVACQLKKLPEKVALESMGYIQSYLVQQRIKTCQQS